VENEFTHRQMVNGFSDLSTITTPNGPVADVNHAALDYFGKTLDELKASFVHAYEYR
jgi:hypothetical protein